MKSKASKDLLCYWGEATWDEICVVAGVPIRKRWTAEEILLTPIGGPHRFFAAYERNMVSARAMKLFGKRMAGRIVDRRALGRKPVGEKCLRLLGNIGDKKLYNEIIEDFHSVKIIDTFVLGMHENDGMIDWGSVNDFCVMGFGDENEGWDDVTQLLLECIQETSRKKGVDNAEV